MALSLVHRVATVGNVVVVAFLALLLVQDRVFNETPPPPVPVETGTQPRGVATQPAGDATNSAALATRSPRRMLLVVIDGLRADTAADEALMPNLARLRRRGAGGEVYVSSLIPSTIAGVVALATGATSPPAAVLQDFRALPAENGGLLEAVGAAGGKTFVAGPRVWVDLYGRWVDRHQNLSHLVHSDDGPLVDAGTLALRSGEFGLVVVHLGTPDDVAHEEGTVSAGYAEAARGADAALGRLVAETGADDLVVVTADHGNTAAGGHAGPEEEVVRVPLVVAGCTMGAQLPVRRQAEIAPWAAEALGVEMPGARGEGRQWGLGVGRNVGVLVICIATGCAVWVCGGVIGGFGGRVVPTVLNASVWAAVALALLGQRGAALVTVMAGLVGGALGSGKSRQSIIVGATAAVAGGALGGLRLHDGTGATWAGGAARNSAWVCAAAAALLCGRVVGRWVVRGGRVADVRGAAVAGTVLVLAAVLCGRIAGQTVSLSTLDVRAGYGLAAHAATVPLAVLVVMAIHAAPTVGVVAGLAAAGRVPTSPLAVITAAAGAACAGQLAVAATVVALADHPRPAALGLNLLLRGAAEAVYLFLALAVVALVRRRPQAEAA